MRIVEDSFQDGSFEIVDARSLGDATKELPGIAKTAQEGGDLLIPDKLDVLVAAPGKRHHKRPGFAQLARGRIDHAPGIAKIHLRLFAWLRLYANRGSLFLAGLNPAHEAPNRSITAGVAPLHEPLAHGSNLYTCLDPFVIFRPIMVLPQFA